MIWHRFGVGVLAVLSPLAVFAGDGSENIAWKAYDQKSGPFYQVRTTRTLLAMRMRNQELRLEQKQILYIRWTPEEKVEGNWVVRQKILGVKMDIEVGGNKIAFDSTQKGPRTPLSDFVDAQMRPELTFHIDPRRLSVVKIDNWEKHVKELGSQSLLASAKPDLQAINLAIICGIDLPTLHLRAETPAEAFPPKEDQKDKTWLRKGRLDLGPFGEWLQEKQFTWDKKDSNKIALTCKHQHKAPDAKQTAGLPIRIRKSEITGQDRGDCHALFDRAKGRFKEEKMDMTFRGSLTFDAGGQETAVDLDMVQTSMVQTQDTNPLGFLAKVQPVPDPVAKDNNGRYQVFKNREILIMVDRETGKTWALLPLPGREELGWVPLKKFDDEGAYLRWLQNQRFDKAKKEDGKKEEFKDKEKKEEFKDKEKKEEFKDKRKRESALVPWRPSGQRVRVKSSLIGFLPFQVIANAKPPSELFHAWRRDLVIGCILPR